MESNACRHGNRPLVMEMVDLVILEERECVCDLMYYACARKGDLLG